MIVDFEPGDRIDVRGVDGLLDPDQVANREDNDFLYLLSGDGGAFIEGVREYLSLFDLSLNFVNDSVVIFPANLGDTFDPARHVSIMLNGVLENNLFDDDYFDWIDPAGGAWVL